MRRIIAAALMITLCLALAACAGMDSDAEKAALGFRTSLLAAGGCDMTARVVADYGDRVYEYTLECKYRRNAQGAVTVVEPEIIAGVTTTLEGKNTTLSYSDLNLDTGKLEGSELTPVGCLPSIALAWEEGYISTTGYESLDGVDCLLVTILTGYDSSHTEYRTWFEKDSMNPVRSEVIFGGRRIISCDYLNYNLI